MPKFRRTSVRRYHWPVVVAFPDPDPAKAGEIVEQTFKVLFEEMPRDKVSALQEEIAALPPKEREAREHDLLIGVVKGWNDDILDDADQPILFSEDELKITLQSTYVQAALYRAYYQSLSGNKAGETARSKN